jgi:pimeloyl-ACP methyl ester carboxylesterase
VTAAAIDTRWGTVEYVDNGDGVPVLLSHGVLGGHDNMRDLVDLWFGPQCRAVGPARFGYLGSARPTGTTVADQADAYAALLDHLSSHTSSCAPQAPAGARQEDRVIADLPEARALR